MRQYRSRVVISLGMIAVGCLALATLSSSAFAEDNNNNNKKKPAPAAAPAKPGTAPGHAAAPGHLMNPQEREHMEREHLAAHEHEFHDRSYHQFPHRDFHHFDERERGLWLAGRWNQTCFAGRCGYWWLAGGVWHYYATPVYPYPLAVSGVVFVEPVAAPVVVVPAVPVVVAPAAPPPMTVQPSAAAQTRYYCENPPGFFPAVQNCNGEFRPVAP